MREILVEADLEMTVGAVVEHPFEAPEIAVDALIRTGSEQHELGAAFQRVEDGVTHQIQTLLRVQPADEGDDRLCVVGEHQAMTQGAFVVVLAVDALDAVAHRDLVVDLGVPDVVVDPVDHTAVFHVMGMQGRLQAEPLALVFGLEGVARRDRGDEIRIDDPGLEQIQCLRIGVVGHAILIEEAFRSMQSGRVQDLDPSNPLMGEVVDGQTHPRMGHPERLIKLVEEDRNQGSLPVVHMDDVRMLARLPEELHRGTREEGVA